MPTLPTPPLDTPARRQLNALVGEGKKWSQRGLARTVLVAQPTVRGWLCGTSRPEPHLRTCVKLVLGIDTPDWDTPEERRHIERVVAQIAGKSLVAPASPSMEARESSRKSKARPTKTSGDVQRNRPRSNTSNGPKHGRKAAA